MNTENPTDIISLDAMRRTSIEDLMKLDLESLKSLQRNADSAVRAARRAQSWVESVIALKLCAQSREENGGK